MNPCPTVQLWFCEKTCILMCSQDHAAGPICDTSGWVCGDIVEEFDNDSFGLFSGCCLFSSNGAESHEEFVVNCVCIV